MTDAATPKLWARASALTVARRHDDGIVEFAAVAGGVSLFVAPVIPCDESPGRALLRRVLTIRCGGDAARWRFVASAHGEPMVENGAGAAPCAFGAARCAGWTIAAVAPDGRVGVDVETVARVARNAAIEDRWLREDERAAMRVLAQGEAARELACRWVLKEAWGKARGVGLAVPPDRVAFHAVGSGIAASSAEPRSLARAESELYTHDDLLVGVVRLAKLARVAVQPPVARAA